jgi:hypothetical protein
VSKWFIVFLWLLLTGSSYAEDNATLLDKYHQDLCDALVNTSNSIDNYFIEEESNQTSTTRAEILSSFAIEEHQDMEKDFRLRLHLSLPKIQKNLHLVFEDESNDNILYDSTTLTDENIDQKRYYLRLEYFKFIKEKLNMVFAGGVRIRNSNLVPYANIRSRYSLYDEQNSSSELFNRFRYYTDGEIEDIFEYNTEYTLNTKWDIFWRNQLSYSNRDEFEVVTNDLFFLKTLNVREQVGVGVGMVTKLQNFKRPTVDYAHLHGLFHHLFYKSWMYYQVVPSILWRESNNFKTSYRYMMNFGVLFSND